jgi:hypothetical protein
MVKIFHKHIVIENNDMTESSDSSSSSQSIESSENKILTPLVKFQSNENLICANLEMPFLRKSKSIHSSFVYLKKELKLEKFKRKTQIDSLLKKCKSKAFRTIHEALKNCLKVKLPRLPQPFITNIKIDFNKTYLEKTIYDIYKEYSIIPSVEDYLEKGFILDDKLPVFKNFLSLTFKEVFESYITSKQYIKDYHHIKKREGEGFAILFNFISKIFVQYYMKSKGNKHKGKNRPRQPKDKNLHATSTESGSGATSGSKIVDNNNVDKKCLLFEIKKEPKKFLERNTNV